MERLTAVVNRLLHPPKWVRLVLPPAVFAALILAFAAGQTDGVPAYALYAVSAYCLILVILPVPGRIKRAKAAVWQRLNGTELGRRYLGSLSFRGEVSLRQGMIMNFLCAVFRCYTGLRYASVWFISMAVYELVLGWMRLSLIAGWRRRERINERSCFRRTARRLFLLNIPMGGMIVLMVRTDAGFFYPGYVIYLSAMYTFYTLIYSVVNLVRFRRLGSPILSAAKVLNFVAALMSLLGLQTAMLAQFSAEGDSFREQMNAITGGVVWGAVILIAVCMLCRSPKAEEGRSVEPIRK